MKAIKWDNGRVGEEFDVESKETDAPRFYSASGYGNKIPTHHMVRINGKWRRVYVCCFSNAGTAYVGKPGAWEFVID